jgi:Heterokaryon incompatibility protein (HET)
MRPGNSPLTPQLAQTSMEKAQHQYQPLENNDTIRILTLDSGQQGDPLTGTLEAVPIDSAGSYEALSYVWADPGPPNSAYNILVRDGDNEGLLVLRGGSIFAALYRLRLPDRPRRIWADQCCINQDDPVERSQQLHFMNRIYQDAAHVLVWLGLDTKKEAVSTFGLIYELNEALGSQLVDGISRDLDTVDLERRVGDNHMALQALTDRAWVGFTKIPLLVQPESDPNTESANSSNADGSCRKLEPGHLQP